MAKVEKNVQESPAVRMPTSMSHVIAKSTINHIQTGACDMNDNNNDNNNNNNNNNKNKNNSNNNN